MKKKPNGKATDTFLRLSHELLGSEEWNSLSLAARVLYIEIAARFNGHNNGAIIFSRREASQRLRVGATKAVQAFSDLQTAGLIEPKQKGWMSGKFRQATRWIVHPLPVLCGTSKRSYVGPVITGSTSGPVSGPPGDQ